MLKYLIIASILALILGVTIILQMAVLALFTDIKFEGFAGYITTQAELEKTVEVMQSKGLDIYRVSFRPSWQVPEENFKGYNTAYIDYLLINTSLSIIVDGTTSILLQKNQ